jgi:hypothetical protein
LPDVQFLPKQNLNDLGNEQIVQNDSNHTCNELLNRENENKNINQESVFTIDDNDNHTNEQSKDELIEQLQNQLKQKNEIINQLTIK